MWISKKRFKALEKRISDLEDVAKYLYDITKNGKTTQPAPEVLLRKYTSAD